MRAGFQDTRLGSGDDSDTQNRSGILSGEILLDASLGESSIFDKHPMGGSANFGQYEVFVTLKEAGYFVETNGRRIPPETALTYRNLQKYGLVICNGKYTQSQPTAIPPKAVDAFTRYIRNGGSLFVIAGGSKFGDGRHAEFYNSLVSRFGLRFREGAHIEQMVQIDRIENHPAVEGLESCYAIHGVPVDAEMGKILAWYKNDPVLALVGFGKGKVIVAGLGSGLMGQCLNTNWRPHRAEEAAKNTALLEKLVDYLLDAELKVEPANNYVITWGKVKKG